MAKTTTIAQIKQENDHAELVRRVLESVAWIAPMEIPLFESITDDNGQLLKLPEGWWPLGMIDTSGTEFGTDVNKTETKVFGYSVPVRIDIDEVPRTVTVTAMEKFKRELHALSTGVNLDNVEQRANGEIKITAPAIVEMGTYRMFTLGRDGKTGHEIYTAKLFPKVQLSEFPAESWTNEAVKTPLKFDVLMDTAVGAPYIEFIAGPGAKEMSGLLGYKQAGNTSI